MTLTVDSVNKWRHDLWFTMQMKPISFTLIPEDEPFGAFLVFQMGYGCERYRVRISKNPIHNTGTVAIETSDIKLAVETHNFIDIHKRLPTRKEHLQLTIRTAPEVVLDTRTDLPGARRPPLVCSYCRTTMMPHPKLDVWTCQMCPTFPMHNQSHFDSEPSETSTEA